MTVLLDAAHAGDVVPDSAVCSVSQQRLVQELQHNKIQHQTMLKLYRDQFDSQQVAPNGRSCLPLKQVRATCLCVQTAVILWNGTR